MSLAPGARIGVYEVGGLLGPAGLGEGDLKPANIKVRQDGAVKVLDFG